MKLIFLHGLGQEATSWKEVQARLTAWPTESLELFRNEREGYASCYRRLLQHLSQQSEDFILIGLSLGGVLALDLSDQDLPHLKGLVLSGSQYQLKQNLLYRLQVLIFQLLPKAVFDRQGAHKGQMLQLLTDLKDLDLTEKAQLCPFPTLILCGSKDKPNLSASRGLHSLIASSHLQIIPGGGHTLNEKEPKAMAEAIQDFLTFSFH